MGISKIPQKIFRQVPGVVGSPWQTGSANTSVSDPIDIGFPFELGGITYKKFVVTTKGWMALVDPSVGTFSYTDVLGPANDASDIGDHFRILQTSSWPHEHLLLAPWFSGALVNFAENLRSSGDAGLPYPVSAYSEAVTQQYEEGYWPTTTGYVLFSSNKDPVSFAVRYCNQGNMPLGRRLTVRWNSWLDFSYVPGSSGGGAMGGGGGGSGGGSGGGGIIPVKLEFEVILYESGRIEFRYGPRNDFALFSRIISSFESAGLATEARATVGIFKKADARFGWEFRDFSPGLGYRDADRSVYVRGGSTYDPTFSDTYSLVRPYVVNLKISKNWPSDAEHGARFVFQPPSRRRKILPRLLIKDIDSRNVMPTVARTGDRRLGNDRIRFDDRRSVAYTSGIVNYPTTLPRFYGNTSEGVAARQDLFSGDFLVTGSTVKSSVQQFIGNEDQTYAAPFEDHKRFENDPDAADDPFFTVGTSTADVGIGFGQPLKSKTQVRLNFNVDEKTTLQGDRSAIYYYSSKNRRWVYPTGAANANPTGGNELASAEMDVTSSPLSIGEHRIVEIDRGFNAYGVPICSGSASDAQRTSPSVERNGTDGILNSLWTTSNESAAINKPYENSFQANVRYSPSEDESFTLPITQPFLIEKAVIEIPIEAGPSWFLDKTQCFLPYASPRSAIFWLPYATYTTNSLGQDIGDASPTPDSYRSNGFHIGGPALTFALFNSVKTGITSQRRELILSGTITHCYDNETEIKLYEYDYFSNPDIPWQVVPRGFNAYGTPSAIVCPDEFREVCAGSGEIGDIGDEIPIFRGDVEAGGEGPGLSCINGGFFTGSVKLSCQAAISNGITVRDTIFADYEGKFSVYGLPAVVDYVFGPESWKASVPLGPLGSDPLSYFDESPDADHVRVYGFREKTIVGVNNLGRGATGLEQSARSIFGKEFVTDRLTDYKNPFKAYDVNGVGDYLSSLFDLDVVYPKVYFTQVISKQKTSVSPYLVLPGDKLSLTVSKSRPFCFQGSVASGSLPFDPLSHDIKLSTGSLNITLYGSLVSNGREFHDTLNQPLASDAIHETFIGGTKTW